MTSTPSIREMRRAFMARDASYDGIFFAAVRTTGIFCRPSCRARKPLAGNLEFFATAGAAMFNGYRACKRCRPLESGGTIPAWVQAAIKAQLKSRDGRLPAAAIRRLGIEPARLRRFFKQHYGMTFQAYCRAQRLSAAFTIIKQGSTVSEAAIEAGYESESGFRSAFERIFGASPIEATNSDVVVLDWLATPVGPMIAGATDKALCLLEFTDRRMLETQLQTVRKRLGMPLLPGRNPLLAQLRTELQQYFAGERQQFALPLSYPGTQFQRSVWRTLLKIPYGETWSYQDVARSIANERAVRAVGQSNGLNRIAIVIPCHRVVNADGKLGGYGGGLWRKQFLLDLERRHSSRPSNGYLFGESKL
ncbi:MAG: methylated-DNA--[protein]-cysteine S-methyltransferase [Steroidobacteraceae bacterium]